MAANLSVGDIVLYTLTAADATQVNRRRTTGDEIQRRIFTQEWPAGAQAHIGAPVNAEGGDELPLIVTAVRKTANGTRLASGQVLLNGTDIFWVQDVEPCGDVVPEAGHWRQKGRLA